MKKQASNNHRHRQYVHGVRIAAPLLDGPRTFEEIVDLSYGYLRPLGLFKISEQQVRLQDGSARKTLQELIQRGWIVQQGEHYSLTPLGQEEVNKRLSQLGETSAVIRRYLEPQTVSAVTLLVHLGLAALKLPAALLSGSVGLLNDAVDTLLDALSSLLLYFGIRANKERSVNIFLVGLMMVTGGFTVFEAVRRFFVPHHPEVDGFTFTAAILSAFFCLGLYLYQRYVGLQSGTMALITQSVDSRNHVIIAASVTAGLAGALFNLPILDTLVGLGVALLILKSAFELAFETIRSLGGEEIDLSRFEFGFTARYEKYRQAQLHNWMLYLVAEQGIDTRTALLSRARQALDFNRIPAMRAMRLAHPGEQSMQQVEQSLSELFRHGWLAGEQHLTLTDKGRKKLEKWI